MPITSQKLMMNLDITEYRKLQFFYSVTTKIIPVPVPRRTSAFIL